MEKGNSNLRLFYYRLLREGGEEKVSNLLRKKREEGSHFCKRDSRNLLYLGKRGKGEKGRDYTLRGGEKERGFLDEGESESSREREGKSPSSHCEGKNAHAVLLHEKEEGKKGREPVSSNEEGEQALFEAF